MDTLILVDKNDKEIGFAGKEECHLIPAKLHRAFSLFIFNSKKQMLLHKRSSTKKTWPGFWTNACCSHPRKGESLEVATHRRLKEELGFDCDLRYLFTFQYESKFDDKYGENEVDHVFLGLYDGSVKPNRDEVEDWEFVSVDELKKDIIKNPKKYTPWFKIALDRVISQIQ